MESITKTSFWNNRKEVFLVLKLRKRGGEIHEIQRFKIYPIFEIRAHECSGREKEIFNFDLL